MGFLCSSTRRFWRATKFDQLAIFELFQPAFDGSFWFTCLAKQFAGFEPWLRPNQLQQMLGFRTYSALTPPLTQGLRTRTS